MYIDKDSMDGDFVHALRSRNVDVLTVAIAENRQFYCWLNNFWLAFLVAIAFY
ncbi:MAG: hypothetical protein RLZZ535_3121 [Cyanobacteriota bacterium]